MKKLTALIVDDEELARIGLIQMLEKIPSINVVGEASNIKSAARIIAELKPDVIFLDIEFPGESGFDLLEKIDAPAKIVFVTAFDEFAIRAFEVNACDYLLKPVSPKRLEKTLQRLESNTETVSPPTERFKYDDQVFVEINYKYHFVKIHDILRVSSAGKYSELLTTGKIKGLVKKTMHEWEDCLPEKQFMRIHRSTIINIELIERIVKVSNTNYRVFLKGSDETYSISRRYASQIKKKMAL